MSLWKYGVHLWATVWLMSAIGPANALPGNLRWEQNLNAGLWCMIQQERKMCLPKNYVVLEISQEAINFAKRIVAANEDVRMEFEAYEDMQSFLVKTVSDPASAKLITWVIDEDVKLTQIIDQEFKDMMPAGILRLSDGKDWSLTIYGYHDGPQLLALAKDLAAQLQGQK